MVLSKPIAAGRTAEVYAYGPGQVLKLFFDWCPPDWVEHEILTAHAINEVGIAAPRAFKVVEVEGRKGIVYERVDGPSMLDSLARRVYKLGEYARTLARLHLEMHRAAPAGLPGQRQELEGAIQHAAALPDDLRSPILETLAGLPDGDRLCHGDFHPGNLILSSGGPVVIDWTTARLGHPAADVARTRLLLTLGEPPPDPFLRLILPFARGVFGRIYLEEYGRQAPEVVRLSETFLPVMTAARFREDIASEREQLLKIIRARWH